MIERPCRRAVIRLLDGTDPSPYVVDGLVRLATDLIFHNTGDKIVSGPDGFHIKRTTKIRMRDAPRIVVEEYLAWKQTRRGRHEDQVEE